MARPFTEYNLHSLDLDTFETDTQTRYNTAKNTYDTLVATSGRTAKQEREKAAAYREMTDANNTLQAIQELRDRKDSTKLVTKETLDALKALYATTETEYLAKEAQIASETDPAKLKVLKDERRDLRGKLDTIRRLIYRLELILMGVIGVTHFPESRITMEVEEITNGQVINRTAKNPIFPSWDGTGVFDDFMEALNGNIETQFLSGRIQGSDYAQAYVATLNVGLTQAVEFVKAQKELVLKQRELEMREREAQNKETTDKLQQESILAQIRIYQRQVEGFDDNVVIKLLQYQYDAFATIFASGMLNTVDTGPLSAAELYAMYEMVKERATSFKSFNVEDRINIPASTIYM